MPLAICTFGADSSKLGRAGFVRVLGLKGRDDLDATVRHYLQALQLDHKVEFHDGLFSTLSLSDGQRRRMALLVAILDDKELYLFDEWAADQDPSFKAVFYQSILPALRERGKAVVAISHDDRYFDVADQVIVLDEGKIAGDVGADALVAAGLAATAFLPRRTTLAALRDLGDELRVPDQS